MTSQVGASQVGAPPTGASQASAPHTGTSPAGAPQAGGAQLQYLNGDLMASVDAAAFAATKPYPWLNPLGLIRPDKLPQLLAEMPSLSQFTPSFGYQRKHGQASFDRYILSYNRNTQVGPAWQGFIDELRGDAYRNFVKRLLGLRRVKFSFQWHYTPRGESVSPHVDSRRKAGAHIFYMNTAQDWQPEWGGQTLILDDGGKFKRDSNPDIASFQGYEEPTIGENRSLIFQRGDRSWHAVRALNCPEGAMRKVFMVTYERDIPIKRWRKKLTRMVKGQPPEDPTAPGVY